MFTRRGTKKNPGISFFGFFVNLCVSFVGQAAGKWVGFIRPADRAEFIVPGTASQAAVNGR
jgi:hypothetical protein